MIRAARVALGTLVLLLANACAADESPPSAPSVPVSEAATLSPSNTRSPSPTVAATPSPTPEPTLSLDLPAEADPRVVGATVAPAIGEDGGTLTVTVTSAADERIDELVLRFPTELNETLFIAPFTPSEERIVDGGPPLVQPWTKWVLGPGEKGEPAGTISIGWGPLLPGATLTIELDATRRAPGPVEFDLQVLAGNQVLTLDDGGPAELRVAVP